MLNYPTSYLQLCLRLSYFVAVAVLVLGGLYGCDEQFELIAGGTDATTNGTDSNQVTYAAADIVGTWRGESNGDYWKITRNADGSFSQDYLSSDPTEKTYQQYYEVGKWTLIDNTYTEASDEGDVSTYEVEVVTDRTFSFRLEHDVDASLVTEIKTSADFKLREPPTGYSESTGEAGTTDTQLDPDAIAEVEAQARAELAVKFAGQEQTIQQHLVGTFSGSGDGQWWKITRRADGTFVQDYLYIYDGSEAYESFIERGIWRYADGVYTEIVVNKSDDNLSNNLNEFNDSDAEELSAYGLVAAKANTIEYNFLSEMADNMTIVETRVASEYKLPDPPAGYTDLEASE